ncbi:tafazzin-like [Amphiura filiformis]|uniref:tafazzin-like n=1 Tax=Amphiura filiformis TaxID=82378 RepID=UPI003B21AD8E
MPLEPWQWVHPATPPGFLWRVGSHIAIFGTAFLSRVWLKWANHFDGYNLESLQDVVDNRPEGTPLITVGNHESCLDDPCLWGALNLRTFLHPHKVRWGLGASDITFTQRSHAAFFSLGQVIPVVRGDGVYQKGIDFCIEKLNRGQWVHFFPEGKVNMTDGFLRFKWGIGRVISECKKLPIIIPFWHIGMDDILHNYPPYIPRIGHRVTMCVGEPIDLRELLAEIRTKELSPVEARKKITDVIQEEMKNLKAKTEAIHYGKYRSTQG